MKRIDYFGVSFDSSYCVNQFIESRDFEKFQSACEYVDNCMNKWQDWFFDSHSRYKLHDVVCRSFNSDTYIREYLIFYDDMWYIFKVSVNKHTLFLG